MKFFRTIGRLWRWINQCEHCKMRPRICGTWCYQCMAESFAEGERRFNEREHDKLKRAVREVIAEIQQGGGGE